MIEKWTSFRNLEEVKLVELGEELDEREEGSTIKNIHFKPLAGLQDLIKCTMKIKCLPTCQLRHREGDWENVLINDLMSSISEGSVFKED